MKNLQIFIQLFKLAIKKSLIYRVDFLITIIAMILWIGIYTIFFEILFLHIDNLAGWSREQVLIFVAFYYLVQSFNNVLFRESFESFSDNLRRGKLDAALTKPASVHLQLFFNDIRFDHMLDFVITMCLFGYVFIYTDINLSGIDMFVGFLLAIVGNVLVYGILLIMSSVLFWVDRLDSFKSTMWQLIQAARYPRQIYTGPAQVFLQFILPVALMVSVPAEFALGKGNLPLLLMFVFISFLFLFIGMFLFHLGLKRYNSANL